MHLRPIGRGIPDGVFDLEQADAFGWTTSALRHAVTTGEIRRVRRGLFVASEEHISSDFDRRDQVARNDAAAAVRSVAGATMSHRSAALWHRMPVLSTGSPCVTVAPGPSLRQPNLHLHRAKIPAGHRDPVARVAVTSAARTIVDLGREHGFAEAVAAGDAALRARQVSRDDIHEVLVDCRGWPGTRAAAAAAEFCDGRSESVLESLSRIKLRDFDLPKPTLQAELRDRFGRFVARVDFLFDEMGVVGEADGLAKYSINGVEEHELRRRQRIENLGFGFVRWQAPDLRHFDIVADRIRHAANHRFVGRTDPWARREAAS